MKLVNVDDIKWQKGVFVNPITDEPIPIIHKMVTIERLRDWQEEAKAIPLDKVKQAKEQMIDSMFYAKTVATYNDAIRDCVEILDKLIESEGVKT